MLIYAPHCMLMSTALNTQDTVNLKNVNFHEKQRAAQHLSPLLDCPINFQGLDSLFIFLTWQKPSSAVASKKYMSEVSHSDFFLINSYCKCLEKTQKTLWQILRVIQQGLAPQTVAIWSANHTILPRTAILHSPIVRPVSFLKGLDLIIRNGSANHCQRSELTPATAFCKLPFCSRTAARDPSPFHCLLKETTERVFEP